MVVKCSRSVLWLRVYIGVRVLGLGLRVGDSESSRTFKDDEAH